MRKHSVYKVGTVHGFRHPVGFLEYISMDKEGSTVYQMKGTLSEWHPSKHRD